MVDTSEAVWATSIQHKVEDIQILYPEAYKEIARELADIKEYSQRIIECVRRRYIKDQ